MGRPNCNCKGLLVSRRQRHPPTVTPEVHWYHADKRLFVLHWQKKARIATRKSCLYTPSKCLSYSSSEGCSYYTVKRLLVSHSQMVAVTAPIKLCSYHSNIGLIDKGFIVSHLQRITGSTPTKGCSYPTDKVLLLSQQERVARIESTKCCSYQTRKRLIVLRL